ncbi:MAG TPA: fumarylacetoacetate hydrolase family protein [Candidatus Xenobia bacterium]|nr:fumarylacetoacetate hydrolase family protein [Candidatus Xenobia bacterium]
MDKYCRFDAGDGARYGVVEGERVLQLTAAPWVGGTPMGAVHDLRAVRLLAPCEPTKIVCIGRNYREHAAELGNEPPKEPLIFLKPPSAVIGPGDAIVYPRISKRVDHEGELGIVIGRRCRRLQAGENPLDNVFGYTCVNDVTARDLQKADVQFTRGKGFDTFCPMGPVIVRGMDASDLAVETYVNGEPRQAGRTSEMIFGLDAIMRFIVGVMTLEPGDVIATGTPSGVGPLKPGDVVEVVVEGIGRLRNPVVAES